MTISPQILDRVQETSVTGGTGTLTLAGASADYQSFATAYAADAVVFYVIEDGTNWECGIGAYTLSGTTLARTTVLASSNGGAAVSFPATSKRVFNGITAAAWAQSIDGRLAAPIGSIAAAGTTCDIGAATAEVLSVTGGTTITAFPSAAAGIERKLIFATATTLTYNATSLILPGSANIVAQPNDVATMLSLGSGNWRCIAFDRVTGAALVANQLTGTPVVDTSFVESHYLQVTIGTGTYNIPLQFVPPPGKRYWRLLNFTMTSPLDWDLSEFRFTAAGVLVAVPTLTGPGGGNFGGIALLQDGIYNDPWYCTIAQLSGGGSPAVVHMDFGLGSNPAIDGFKFAEHFGGTHVPTQCEVQSSLDDSTWTHEGYCQFSANASATDAFLGPFSFTP